MHGPQVEIMEVVHLCNLYLSTKLMELIYTHTNNSSMVGRGTHHYAGKNWLGLVEFSFP